MIHCVQKEFTLLIDILSRLMIGLEKLYEFLGHSICLDASLPVYGRTGSLGFLDLCWEEVSTSDEHFYTD